MKENNEKLIVRQLIIAKVSTTDSFFAVQRKFCRKLGLPFARNIDLLRAYRELINDNKIKPSLPLSNLLKKRKVRTLSGIASITVITKPFACPGRCLYCPNEKNMPKSYLANEPACMRAVLTKFDPYRQVQARLNSLTITGHATDKIELIVLGGTWSSYPKKYQTWFIKRCFEACNKTNLKGKAKNVKQQTLTEVKKINERARHRIVGLTLETRPDFINPAELKRMRWLGCTRIELGVQSLDEQILKYNRRDHQVKDVIQATKMLKNAGFKVTYHMMLNLPHSNPTKDWQMFVKLFSSEDFQPDQLKIYPCAVLRTAPLYKIWQKGEYQPYSQSTLTNLLIKIKKIVPYYVRIIRIIRDIPSESIVAGNKVSNLRQLIAEEAGQICHCIRCREPKTKRARKLKLFRQDYQASGGQEIFLSLEDEKRKNLYAFLRLRLTVTPTFPFLKDSALLRELHTYGRVARLQGQTKQTSQHHGLGRQLMSEAEKIVKEEFKLPRMAVISGVGVRQYYRKLGYRLKNEYMFKKLK